MERETLLTGIGGQGIQLAARTLAFAAVGDGLEVMVFGSFGGVMRGGNTDATVVIGDGPLQSPPTVVRGWSAIAMHHDYWPATRDRVVPGGVAVIDRSVFLGDVGLPGRHVIEIEATKVAADLGNPQGASMVALGALAGGTGLVTIDALLAAATEVLPPYRAQHAAANAAALAAGYELVPTAVAAWETGVAAGRSS